MTPEAMADRRMRRMAARIEQAPEVRWRQLCAITRNVFEVGIDTGEWSERVKDRLVALGFQYDSARITDAIEAVARVVPRPVVRPVRPFWSLRT